jgi:hypothetical protein
VRGGPVPGLRDTLTIGSIGHGCNKAVPCDGEETGQSAAGAIDVIADGGAADRGGAWGRMALGPCTG